MRKYPRIFMGRYTPGRTLAHRLDTRIKVSMIGLYSVLIWSVNTWNGLGLMLLVSAGWALLAGGAAGRMLVPLRGLAVVSLFVLAYYIWSGVSFAAPVRAGHLLQALSRTIFLMGKISLTLVSAAWLYLFTPPLKVVDALGSLLRPLERLKIPVREFSFTVGLVLRFFPEAVGRIGEFHRLLQLRGKTGENPGGPLKRLTVVIKRVVDTMVLYMHYSLHGSQMVALGLFVRGYNPFRKVHPARFRNPLAWEYAVLAVSCGAILAAAAYL